MTGNIDRFMEEIKNERKRQDDKWGKQYHKPVEWLCILTEEVGEATEDATGRPVTRAKIENTITELIQCSAVAVAMVESSDMTSAHIVLDWLRDVLINRTEQYGQIPHPDISELTVELGRLAKVACEWHFSGERTTGSYDKYRIQLLSFCYTCFCIFTIYTNEE